MTKTEGRTAIVTGAGSGIGRASALALLARGYRVALAGRTLSTLQETAAESGAAASNVLPIATDISDASSVRNLVETAVSVFGRLDLLFNNAGTNVTGVSFENLTLAQWSKVIDVNVTGAFLCGQAAFRQMMSQEPRGGRIINNGSISAHAPRPDSAPYTASKHAITGLTKAIALDGRAHDIACGQIDIGNAQTSMANRMAQGVKQADGRIAPEPMIDVSDVARAVVTMADLPLGVNIQFMTIMATKMPFIGRG